jgi:pimeloyl-ACP methyl ester carboxylesterase
METLEVPIDVGEGAPLVLFHGYAMRPSTYGALAGILASRCRVVVPDLFALRGRWSYERTLQALTATLDAMGLDRVSMLAHSFGGGIQLGLASTRPERVVELVFSDTLGVSREWGLADESLRHPLRLLRLATPVATTTFVRSWVTHPRQLADAGWWGFTSGRDHAADAVAEAGLPAHVLWANRDSVLSRRDGEAFAGALGASFTVATGPGRRPVDHDWMFQQPTLFVRHLDRLGLEALTP